MAYNKRKVRDRMTELMQLSGSVIKEESKKRNGLQQEMEMDMEQLVYASVMYEGRDADLTYLCKNRILVRS